MRTHRSRDTAPEGSGEEIRIKFDRVLATLVEADRTARRRITGIVERYSRPADGIRAIGVDTADQIGDPAFRGCPFLGALAEHPDPRDPVHRIALGHREWFLATVTGLLAASRGESAELLARHFVMLRDGAMVAGRLFGPGPIGEAFVKQVDQLMRYRIG